MGLTAPGQKQHMCKRPLAENQEQPHALRKIISFLGPGMSSPPAFPAMLRFSPSVWGELAQVREAEWPCLYMWYMSVPQGSACDNPPLHGGRVKWKKCWAEEVKLLESQQSSEILGGRLLPSMSHTLVSLGCADAGGVTAVGCCT